MQILQQVNLRRLLKWNVIFVFLVLLAHFKLQTLGFAQPQNQNQTQGQPQYQGQNSDPSSSNGSNGGNGQGLSTESGLQPDQESSNTEPKSSSQALQSNEASEPRYWRTLTKFSDLSISEMSFGLHVGEPTGLASRLFIGESKAVSMQGGWSFQGLSAFHFSADLLLYLFDALSLRKLEVDSYMGPGLFIKVWQNERLKISSDGSLERKRDQTGSFGFRMPAGVSLYLLKPAIELYFEVTPAMGLIPATEFNLDFGAGLLFRFGLSKKKESIGASSGKLERPQSEGKK